MSCFKVRNKALGNKEIPVFDARSIQGRSAHFWGSFKMRPIVPHPLPRLIKKGLTDTDHFCMIRTAQRRFAPTVDRHHPEP
jgi:hypothetical protein